MLSSLVGKMALVDKIQPVMDASINCLLVPRWTHRIPSLFMVLADSSYLMHLGFDHRQTLQPWGGVEWTWIATQALQMWRYCWGQLKKCWSRRMWSRCYSAGEGSERKQIWRNWIGLQGSWCWSTSSGAAELLPRLRSSKQLPSPTRVFDWPASKKLIFLSFSFSLLSFAGSCWFLHSRIALISIGIQDGEKKLSNVSLLWNTFVVSFHDVCEEIAFVSVSRTLPSGLFYIQVLVNK